MAAPPVDCPLQVVATEGFALAAPLATPAGTRDLPRGSLVRRAGTCAGGVAVEVVSVAGWVPVATPGSPGDRGCMAPTALAPLDERVFVALADGTGVAAGDLLGPVDDPGRCDATTYTFRAEGGASARTLALADLAVVRAVDRETLAGVDAVRAAYAEAFGPIPRHRVPWTDWGRVGLPLEALTPAEIEAEWAREGLGTPARREKAVVARGPAWLHFLGSDAPGSDVWARPETVVALVRLARGWVDHCAATVASEAAAAPARCTLQVGDLAWYNARTPDPLGHRDHADGACVDLRLFRTDGSRYEAWWNRPDDRTGVHAYDAATTAAFLRWATASAPVTDVFFNDPAVVAQVPGVRALPGHDDHVHLCFAGR